MRHHPGAASRIVGLFLVVQVLLVHCLGTGVAARAQAIHPLPGGAGCAEPKGGVGMKIAYGSDHLPAAVEDMREAILSAVRSGRIEELRHAYERNELKPDLGVPVA